MNIDAGRLLCMQAADLKDKGMRNTKQAAFAKAFCADMAMKVATMLCRCSVAMDLARVSRRKIDARCEDFPNL